MAHRAVREVALPRFVRIRAFARASGGNVAIITAFAAFPLLMAIAVALDTAEIHRARENLQQAADAAVLTAARAVMSGAGRDEAEMASRRVFEANMANLPTSRATLEVEATREACRRGEMVARATMRHPLHFGAITGIVLAGARDGGELSVVSNANCGNGTVEIALVLDNSGSMKGEKLDALKKATKKLVRDLFEAAEVSSRETPVAIALVPFASMVNVGAHNANAAWMDRQGDVAIHHENFDWAHAGVKRQNRRWMAGDTPLTRFVVYDQLGIAWKGCVEKRRHPLHLTDAPGDAPLDRFVPAFAPDEPDDWTSEYERAERDGPRGRRIDEWAYRNSYLRDDRSYPHYRQSRNHHHPDLTGAPFGQIYRQFWVTKYFYDAPVDASRPGPNDFCEAQPLMPLVNRRRKAIQAIEAMRAGGATDVQAGVSWGWKALSPQAPLEEGRPYGTADNRKIMIVMTDGENTYYPNGRPTRSHYGAFGQAWQGRIFAGTSGSKQHTAAGYREAMDEHLVATCANAKAADITLYTIAFDVPKASTARTVMRACASREGGDVLAFDAEDNEALVDVFEAIGRSIRRLRLTR